ncbi:oxysterol-binding protein-related protein 11 isoform X1 [Lingula anatina]|uniref:Oxysterol-binding protein n=2 Tax=Lingula anatina TaxID=7574 RepID=A0A1S3KE81_LINAN|nr:oxysterol-binding protein-related protein 11 isoform X1 [Lingula anatina]|eukprot:XP_013420807.1 oxysterol-binding protein-related protein 11 isoform X1 [Lingula anatina]
MAAVGGGDDGPNLEGLSEEEKQKLLDVIKRAKEFEVEEEKLVLRQPLEGVLCKYTNVMKGWQFRWFVLVPETGMLEYYEKEEHKKVQRPRGSVHLAGAVISPSDEDSQTFNVNAANTEIYRLRASDAKERVHWVNRLRAVAEYHSNNIAQNAPPIYRHESRTHSFAQETLPSVNKRPSSYGDLYDNQPSTTVTVRSHHKTVTTVPSPDPLHNVKEVLSQVTDHEEELVDKMEELPSSGHFLNSLDKEILLLKATSKATVLCLEQCMNMLQQQASGVHAGRGLDWSPNMKSRSSTRSSSVSSIIKENLLPLEQQSITVPVNHDDDVSDEHGYTDTDLGGVEEHKSVILHLLSQLKLGMDLTRVVLPTFILEKRSLLEMFADCMAHPDIFAKIPDCTDPESRMLQVVEWYLTSFHAARQGSVAKKPYNPIIGETFHCSWDIPQTLGDDTQSDNIRLTYCAEQVSHHPPISAFYFECPKKNMYVNASIWTKSKFMGMSIGVVMVGKVTLSLVEHNEDYVFSLPSAYARSILTYPWVELGDRVTITCQQTGYAAAIVFHTKPFYGGKLHRVSAEVKNPEGTVICKVNGDWNGTMEFTNTSAGTSKVIDVSKLEIKRKKVRPMSKLGDFESRKLWQHVTNALKLGDIETATEHKRFLEERQREGEKYRKETNTPFAAKYFNKEGDVWVYKKTLKK